MVEFVGASAARGLLRVLAPFAAAATLAAAGFGTAEIYEHKTPWGLGPKRDAAHALAVTNATNWRAMKADRDGWRDAHGREVTARLADAAAAARSLDAAQDARERGSSSAFDRGYTAGKVAGRNLAQGAAHAPSDPASARPDAGRVRDPADDLTAVFASGAYRP